MNYKYIFVFFACSITYTLHPASAAQSVNAQDLDQPELVNHDAIIAELEGYSFDDQVAFGLHELSKEILHYLNSENAKVEHKKELLKKLKAKKAEYTAINTIVSGDLSRIAENPALTEQALQKYYEIIGEMSVRQSLERATLEEVNTLQTLENFDQKRKIAFGLSYLKRKLEQEVSDLQKAYDKIKSSKYANESLERGIHFENKRKKRETIQGLLRSLVVDNQSNIAIDQKLFEEALEKYYSILDQHRESAAKQQP